MSFWITENLIYGLDHYLNQVDVLPFIETADVVRFGCLSFMENQVDGTGMVFHIEPVAYIFSLSIHRQWLAMTDVVDEQWNQLFRELIRTVVVRTVRYDGRHAVGVMVRTHEMVATSLRC